MTKKFLLIQILILMIFFVSFSESAVFATDFPDVPKQHENYTAITYLAKVGVIAGYEDGTFSPEREITRTEFCALMARTLGFEKDSYVVKEIPFSDVPQGYWGEAYISFCYELGLIDGMGDGSFAPAAKVTLEQAVKMAVCAIDKQEAALRIKGEKWYSGYVIIARQQRLLSDVSEDFGENAVRGNIAQVVYNMTKCKTVDVSGILEPKEEVPEIVEPPAEEDEPNSSEIGEKDEEEYTAEELAIIQAFKDKDYSDVETIVIDAGHNFSGCDTGAINEAADAHEEIINWQIADKLRILLEDMGYRVIMTRPDVTDNVQGSTLIESLQSRVDIAHSNLADMFISIHCNAGGGNGVETYCFSESGYSGRLAKLVQEKIAENTGLYDRGVKTANFYVIKNTVMPAILVESGFIDNSSNVEILTSESGQMKIAEAIAEAVGIYDNMSPIRKNSEEKLSEAFDSELTEEEEPEKVSGKEDTEGSSPDITEIEISDTEKK